MIKLAIGFVLGMVISQVGISGLARMLDNSVTGTKTQIETMSK
jgi:hypothetical protein